MSVRRAEVRQKLQEAVDGERRADHSLHQLPWAQLLAWSWGKIPWSWHRRSSSAHGQSRPGTTQFGLMAFSSHVWRLMPVLG